MKLSSLNYNYCLTVYNNGKVKIKYYSQLKDIVKDHPEMTLSEIQYRAKNATYKQVKQQDGFYIRKIIPISKYGISKFRENLV